ncbi:hypothetical protein SAMCFNEI73_Ch3447 [Sinorhizobium americanum]|uniref:Uncharacterized protein n=1 Tax=Sinorhizobium americanum TaxID=194963 RepID=A0A1L3LRJ4_9HYPH|nr:hypothetical protein SAMCCGM7_Ch3324 [Sinorhizobium americanum CCGM7]APG92700.1 hypothetical protein SAMCFNEI73_Ch3447 [Sinorhizobium americanum]
MGAPINVMVFMSFFPRSNLLSSAEIIANSCDGKKMENCR